jgi:hypothetical protein
MKVSTRVAVTVLVESGPSWSPECTMSEIQKRSAEEAKLTVKRALGTDSSIKVVGNPQVSIMVVSEDD